MTTMREKLKKAMLCVALIGLGYILCLVQHTNNETAGQGFIVKAAQEKIEVSLGTSDKEITDMAKFAVSASLDGETVNSKELKMFTSETGIAETKGEKDIDFTCVYKNEVENVTLHYVVIDKVSEASKPMDADEAIKKTDTKAVVHKTALATPIKSSKMSVKGNESVKVDTKGFHQADETPIHKDVTTSIEENKNSSKLEVVASKEELISDDVDQIFGSTEEEVETSKEAVNEATSDEVKVSEDLNKKVEEATSKEVETVVENGKIHETSVKVTAKLLVIKMADGKVINLTSNLSGNVPSGESVRLVQSTDGTFKDMATGTNVDFSIGTPSTRIVEGFSNPVVIYNTNAGIYYVA